jgi:hypothetical protein
VLLPEVTFSPQRQDQQNRQSPEKWKQRLWTSSPILPSQAEKQLSHGCTSQPNTELSELTVLARCLRRAALPDIENRIPSFEFVWRYRSSLARYGL